MSSETPFNTMNLERLAASDPDTLAIMSGDASLTYGAWLQSAEYLAGMVRRAVSPGSGVWLDFPDDDFVGWAVAYSAARIARCVPVSGGSGIVSSPDFVRMGIQLAFSRESNGIRPRMIQLQHEAQPVTPPIFSDVADVVFTSGSTGDPKGYFRHWMQDFDIAPLRQRDRPRRRYAGVFPAGTAAAVGVMDLFFRPRRTEAHLLTVYAAARVASLLRTIEDHEPDSLRLSQGAAISFTAISNAPLPSVQWCKVSGGRVSSQVLDGLARRLPNAKIVVIFGATESGRAALVREHRPGDPEHLGHPTPGTRVRVVDSRGLDVLPGEIGELELTSSQLVTAVDGGAVSGRTGDLVRGTTDGRLVLVGRSKEVIILGGRKIPIRAWEVLLDSLLQNGEWIQFFPLKSATGTDVLEYATNSPTMTLSVVAKVIRESRPDLPLPTAGHLLHMSVEDIGAKKSMQRTADLVVASALQPTWTYASSLFETAPQLVEKLVALVGDHLPTIDSRDLETLGIDSFGRLELYTHLEDHFGALPVDEFTACRSVDELIALCVSTRAAAWKPT